MKPEDRKRLKQHIEMVVDHKVDWRDEYRKLKVEFDTLRLKESQEQRFIWWVLEVYAKNVRWLMQELQKTTFPVTPFGLSAEVQNILRVTEHIYDGTYLDVEISTDVKRDLSDAEIEELGAQEAENRAEPSNSDSPVTQNIIQRPADPSLEEDE